MFSKAFVLINTELGEEEPVCEELNKIPEIKETNIVYGMYDIVAIVECTNIPTLKDIVSQSIREIEGIQKTLTLLCVSHNDTEVLQTRKIAST